MVTETKQTIPTKVEEVKVIVVKLPFDLQERLLTFPFLQAIREKYPEADLHFITPKKEIEILNLLPFKAYYHEFDEDEIQSVFDVHRYCIFMKVFNVDLFISLTNSFVDGCLGWGLRAKKRLGFSDGWKTLLFNIKTPRPRGHHVVEDFFALYSALIGGAPNSKLKVMSRDLKPMIVDEDASPYVAINLAPLRDVSIDEDFIELINYFENQRIILFSSEDQAKVQMISAPFMAKLNRNNQCTFFIYKDWIELGRMLAFSRGVITFNGPLASLSAYVGAKTLILYDSDDPQRYGPFYFLSDVMTLGVNDPTLVHSAHGDVLKERKRFKMDEVYTKSVKFFSITF